MAIRFDYGELKSPFKTEDGILICEATFARDGVLEYRQPNGSIRKELRLPEENKKALTTFGIAPVTIEHPPVLVTEDNAERYRKGISLQNVVYGKGGFVRGEVAILDSEAIDYATRQDGAEVSAGYLCDIEETSGIWQGLRYDCIQRNIRVNHIALTKRGRAGPEVKLHLDSADDSDIAIQIPSTQTKRMATIRIDGADYEIPESLAPLIAPKLKRLDALEEEVSDLEERVENLSTQLEEASDERDRERGRADGYDIVLTNAEILLDELGYKRDSSGNYFRTDKKKSMKEEMEMEDEDMEMEEDEEMMDMMDEKSKKKKKDGGYGKKMDMAKKDSADVRNDAKALMMAWKEADQLTGQSLSEAHFDSVETPEDIHRLVVATLRPTMKLDSLNADAVEGIYEFLKTENTAPVDRTDSRKSYGNELSAAIAGARAGGMSSGLEAASQARSTEVSSNYTKPLSLSR